MTRRTLGASRFPFLLIACIVGLAGPLNAGIVDIGGGWRAEWDPSLDPFVQIVSNGVIGDAVFIQKAAEFTQPPVQGIFPTIPILFRQTEWPAVSNIVIDDEIITNSTGHDWDDFHLVLLDGPDAMFDPVATLGSGGPPPIGWSIGPFTQAAFTPDNMRLDIWDGLVPHGTSWFPGSGAQDGQLWINTVPQQQAPFTVFTLKETPTPEPTALALLGLASLLATRRVRS